MWVSRNSSQHGRVDAAHLLASMLPFFQTLQIKRHSPVKQSQFCLTFFEIRDNINVAQAADGRDHRANSQPVHAWRIHASVNSHIPEAKRLNTEKGAAMKFVLFISIISFAIAMPVRAELTPEDLDRIRLIIKEEIKEEIAPLKADIEALKIDVARLEERVSGIEKQIALLTNAVYGLIALIVVAIGIPAWRGRRDRDQERKIEELTREIEALKQQRIVNP